ncbi:pentapeptide repeat-containing protein [Streptomyces chartreusis]|uniref:pentapeptide repeat-containing protein n=1 Tax=Streptomyces chartreusis TaxID=1969 RepID=UPI00367B17EF
MPQSHPETPPSPPDWPYCGTPGSESPFGCPGIHVPGHIACLAHLSDADRESYLAGLTPGADIDHRGTPFTRSLLDSLLAALRSSVTGNAQFGLARFESATFESDAVFVSAIFAVAAFDSATFKGDTWFTSAVFEGGTGFELATFERDVEFGYATFRGSVGFESAVFKGKAWFGLATFEAHAEFGSATFEGSTVFPETTFKGYVGFDSATFTAHAGFASAKFQGHAAFNWATFKDVEFEEATFMDDAAFWGATFQSAADFEAATFAQDVGFHSAVFKEVRSLGPFVCAGSVALSGALFDSPVTLAFTARSLECIRTRWSSKAEVRLRHTTVHLAHAVLEYPLTIAVEQEPFVLSDGEAMPEEPFMGTSDGSVVRIASLRGVDAAHLALTDVDLSGCLFAGAVHLDQLRLEGTCSFDTVPPGTHWRAGRPVRFTRRRTLAEEHHWRARQPAAVRGWNAAVFGASHVGPAQLAPVYRALRKAFEDSKNEPGAADFYYGEMEMRRHDREATTGSERGLLHGYWMLCGYGLRAARALGWLAASMLVTLVLLMGFGLPQDIPKQTVVGTVPAGGGRITLEIDTDDPQGPTGNRFTSERFEKAVNVMLNSVVFRSSGQNLTTAGTYIEMASRLAEPVLLGLAVLAVRNRVKR